MNAESSVNQLKKLTFYYKSTQQILSVCNGTSQADIIQTLKMVFGIPSQKNIFFIAQDGTLLVLSSALPGGTKLTVIDQDYQFTKIGNNNTSDGKWKWKKNTESVFINDMTFKTNDERKTCVYGDVKMTKGNKYWWKISMSEIWCCQQPGIVKESIKEGFWKSKPETYHEAIGFPDKFEGYTTGPGSTGCNSGLKWKNHVYLFYLDFKDCRLVIINETQSAILNDAKVTFDIAVPYFYSNKHANTITLIDTGDGQVEPKWMKLMNKDKK